MRTQMNNCQTLTNAQRVSLNTYLLSYDMHEQKRYFTQVFMRCRDVHGYIIYVNDPYVISSSCMKISLEVKQTVFPRLCSFWPVPSFCWGGTVKIRLAKYGSGRFSGRDMSSQPRGLSELSGFFLYYSTWMCVCGSLEPQIVNTTATTEPLKEETATSFIRNY